MLLSREPNTASRIYQALFTQKNPLGELLGAGGNGAVYQLRDTNAVVKINPLTTHTPYLKNQSPFSLPVEVKYNDGIFHADGKEYHAVRGRNFQFSASAQLIERGILHYIREQGRAEKAVHRICVLEEDYFVVHQQDLYLILVERKARGSELSLYQTLSEKETAFLITQFVPLFSFLKKIGVIHKDIKPTNILYTHSTATKLGDATLLDFGSADFSPRGIENLTDENTKEIFIEYKARQRRNGVVEGTPQYMSPEQARGEELDWVSDLYSFGLTLAEMLTRSTLNPDDALISLRQAADHRNPLQSDALRRLREREVDSQLTAGIEVLLDAIPERRSLQPLQRAARQLLRDLGYNERGEFYRADLEEMSGGRPNG